MVRFTTLTVSVIDLAEMQLLLLVVVCFMNATAEQLQLNRPLSPQESITSVDEWPQIEREKESEFEATEEP